MIHNLYRGTRRTNIAIRLGWDVNCGRYEWIPFVCDLWSMAEACNVLGGVGSISWAVKIYWVSVTASQEANGRIKQSNFDKVVPLVIDPSIDLLT